MLGWNVRWIPGALLVASIAVGAATRADVLVVDMTNGPFHEVQQAVLAAQDGDTILVRPPPGFQRYQPIEIAGKALTVAADSVAGTASIRSVVVRDLPAGKTVVLSRLRAITFMSGVPPATWLHDNAGSVRLVACEAWGGPGDASAALGIERSSGTALAACNLVGGAGGGGDEVDGFPGAAGLELEDALAAFYDCTITGGEGGFLYIADNAGPGGAGALVARETLPTRLFLANSSIQGGPGGLLYWCEFGLVSGDGGPGLILGAGTSALRIETTIAGGPGGELPDCGGTSGATGPALVGPGVLYGNPTSALRLTTPTVAREQQTITLTFDGSPGDQVILICGLETTYHEWPDGVLLVQPGGVPFFADRGPIGTIGPSGTLDVEVALPPLPATVDAANLWFQALAVHANGKRTLGSFAVVTVVDSKFRAPGTARLQPGSGFGEE